MMKSRIAGLALAFGISGAALAADVPAPVSIVIVACRVDDLTGQPGRHDPNLAAKGWRDLELKIIDGEYLCKREQIDLTDKTALENPNVPELQPNLGSLYMCAKIGIPFAAEWNDKNRGWAVVAIGCPTKIVNEDGRIVGWKLPECPMYLPGTNNRMKCRFDGSLI